MTTSAVLDEDLTHRLHEAAQQLRVDSIRTTRGETPVLYSPGERFDVGGSRVLRAACDD